MFHFFLRKWIFWHLVTFVQFAVESCDGILPSYYCNTHVHTPMSVPLNFFASRMHTWNVQCMCARVHMYIHVSRIGISGEPAPRHIIRSRVEMKPYGAVSVISLVLCTCTCMYTCRLGIHCKILERVTDYAIVIDMRQSWGYYCIICEDRKIESLAVVPNWLRKGRVAFVPLRVADRAIQSFVQPTLWLLCAGYMTLHRSFRWYQLSRWARSWVWWHGCLPLRSQCLRVSCSVYMLCPITISPSFVVSRPWHKFAWESGVSPKTHSLMLWTCCVHAVFMGP